MDLQFGDWVSASRNSHHSGRITKNVDATNLQISSFGQLSSNLETFATSLTALENDNARTAATGSVAAN